MILKPLQQIAEADIQDLLDNEVPEGRSLDYKLTLPGNSDADKKEFLADVSSFANAAGGHLVFGISEQGGIPTNIEGLSGVDLDAEILRLENLVRDGIDPRIPGLHMKAVERGDDAPVLIIHIPKSWMGPHMVTFKNTSKFHTRNSAGKYQMDVTEIRSAFSVSDELPKKIEAFRNERLAKIIAGETPVPIKDEPRLAVHIMPLSAFTPFHSIAPSELYQINQHLSPLRTLGYSPRINLDGLVVYTGADPEFIGYCQTFRSGIIEAVDASILRANESNAIPSIILVQAVEQGVGKYLLAFKALEIMEPAILQISLLGAKGYKLADGDIWDWQSSPALDRETLLLPDILIEDYAADVHSIIKPALDALWNTCGHHGCSWYDEAGNWQPPRR
ncbi:helix-turn-helix domain-containing protein [Mariprofundus ferrooxydans]|uniref:AlbA family DNA-binding domain-containing protein n=1 Tax=Mariprofundus ferrooxydans TaxID=314344 RepID=UPI0006A6C4B3|nr:ATP-binding protein [Mariprofundus ferrooxydans]